LIFALPAGILCSRVDAVLSLLIVSIVALIGYASICFVEDPTGTYGMICACIIGVGEIGVIVAAQSLTSRQAPPKVRGAVGGTAGLFGSLGILFCSKLGGHLYDTWDPTGPFLLFSCCNALLIVVALVVYIRTGDQGGARGKNINDGDKQANENSRLLADPPVSDDNSQTTGDGSSDKV